VINLFRAQDLAAETLQAISKSQAVIEFSPDGTILQANANFLEAMGYGLDEVVGKHHRLFVEPDYAGSAEYRLFWDELRQGRFKVAEFKRLGKGGREVWIQASYNPVLDRKGKVAKIVKFATDVTEQKLGAADMAGQIDAIRKSQAVIEFSIDGTILCANDNFLQAVGYRLDEVQGRHHRMFVEPAYAASAEYKEFWTQLKAGVFQAAEYRRVGKGGREVWIQATYNPIFDLNGKAYKVVKYATDVTARKQAVHQLGEHLARLADGDLTAQVENRLPGELEDIRLAFNRALERVADSLMQLSETSHAVRSATGEILAGANDLAERTTKQAATIEETSAAMEQLSQTVVSTSKKAEEVAAHSQSAAHLASEGGQVMLQATEAMERISTSSTKISAIIGMIDDIAFQTNLLALNASVEAARAGEAGKGFAVVAIEVRRLAQSAAKASSEVKQLIEQSSNEVQGGSKLVENAAAKLRAILKAVTENSALMKGISASSQEQSASLREVNIAVRQMDEMTQHNAALVEETNAAIEQTNAQVTKLDEIVGTFRTGAEAQTYAETPVRRLQRKAASAGRTLKLVGSTTRAQDWREF
jgi:methyl-accepting chemotaxis protein